MASEKAFSAARWATKPFATASPDQSVFLQYLTDRLTDNSSRYITADALFADFRQAVINNSPNTPQYGVIYQAGDEGGEFVFVHRD